MNKIRKGTVLIFMLITINLFISGCAATNIIKGENQAATGMPTVTQSSSQSSIDADPKNNKTTGIDPALLKLLGEELNKDCQNITYGDCSEIGSLEFSRDRLIKHGDNPDLAYDFSFLSNMPKLAIIDFGDIKVKDISAVNNCPKLVSLSIANLTDKDTEKLKTLSELSGISINKSSITNLNFLKCYPNLVIITINDMPDFPTVNVLNSDIFLDKIKAKDIFLYNMGLTGESIAAIHQFNWVYYLTLDQNNIEKITDFPDAPNLEVLQLNNNPLKSLNIPVGKAPKLKTLSLANTDIEDLNQIKGLDNLEFISLLNTKVTCLAPLKKFKKLKFILVDTKNIRDLNVFEDTNIEISDRRSID